MKNSIFLIFALCLMAYASFSQKISTPEFEINHHLMPHLIKSKAKSRDWENSVFNDTDSMPRSTGSPIRLKPFYTHLGKTGFAPFILGKNDTIYANASYFQWLKKADAIFPVGATVIGKLKKGLKHNTQSAEELFHLLMASRVINTYRHLHAKLTVTRIAEDDRSIEIAYDGKHYMCTSKCFDTDFAFKLRFNKQTNEIILLP